MQYDQNAICRTYPPHVQHIWAGFLAASSTKYNIFGLLDGKTILRVATRVQISHAANRLSANPIIQLTWPINKRNDALSDGKQRFVLTFGSRVLHSKVRYFLHDAVVQQIVPLEKLIATPIVHPAKDLATELALCPASA